jgi:hypothetical protein
MRVGGLRAQGRVLSAGPVEGNLCHLKHKVQAAWIQLVRAVAIPSPSAVASWLRPATNTSAAARRRPWRRRRRSFALAKATAWAAVSKSGLRLRRRWLRSPVRTRFWTGSLSRSASRQQPFPLACRTLAREMMIDTRRTSTSGGDAPAPMRADPPRRRDGRCPCGKERPAAAITRGDPFCSSKCAREWHNQPDEPSRSKPS